MHELECALSDAGGMAAPPATAGRLRGLLVEELARGRDELALTRSGYGAPVAVATASSGGALVGVAPVAPGLRADPETVTERAWRVAAALVAALCDVAGLLAPARAGDLVLLAGELESHLVLAVPAPGGGDAELAALAYEEATARIDRLRTRALALPGHVLDGAQGVLRPPIGAHHPLRVAEAVARLGGRPADDASVEAHEDAVLALLGVAPAPARPHDDPDPARRLARRILQRLHGMGKWGGYHTEFAHLARGFQGNDRARAEAVGEALLAEGLLSQKRSVGQRHVFLNPRRAGEIHTLIDTGATPAGLVLP